VSNSKQGNTDYYNTCTVRLLSVCTMNQQMHNQLTIYYTAPYHYFDNFIVTRVILIF